MEEILDLAQFRQQLKAVAPLVGVPFERLRRAVQMDQIPSWVITSTLRKHSQTPQNRHKGSEVNDRVLIAFAAYADIVFVDKRTKENFKRATMKDGRIKKLATARVEKAPSYRDVVAVLDALPRNV